MKPSATFPRLLADSFEAKGRLGSYLQTIPAFVLRASDAAGLLGACRALDAGMKH